MNRHRGLKVQVYLQADDLAKLDNLKEFSNRGTRSDALRMLIRGRPFIDKSFKECLSQLGRIGGLIKKNGLLPAKELKELQNAVYEMRGYLYGEDSHKG